jgi:hypothetical protein
MHPVNRDVSITLYRDYRIGFGYGDIEQAARIDHGEPNREPDKELLKFPSYQVKLA